MLKVGLIVNPIAGMGGKVGLKGTDGEMYKKAVSLGAKPITNSRIHEVLSLIKREDLSFICAPKAMGEDSLKEFDFPYKVVGSIKDPTTSEDTKKIAKVLIEEGVNILVFVGGDGTARDILDAVGTHIPVIAVPSGVKMFSSAFVFTPHAAAEMINNLKDDFIEKEVLDIDENAFRENRLDAKYYGTVYVPNISHLLQGKKTASTTKGKVVDKKKEVAKYIIENMEDDCLYILGPGTTVNEIAKGIGVPKTLLGIDAIYNKELIGTDINEITILSLIKTYPKAKIIVTPIGGNGFIFGRGSRQISADILDKIGKENIIIVSTIEKVGNLPCLRIDSGNHKVDKDFAGFINVIIDYNDEIMMEVKY